MCWACLQENHLNLPQNREGMAAYQTVSTSKALLAKLEYPEANWANTVPGSRGPVIVTYSFLESQELPPVSGGTFGADSHFAFSQTQRSNFRKALDEFTRVTGLIFVEKSGESMIEVHGADGSAWAGWANYPNSSATVTDGSTLVIDDNGQLAVGTYGFTTALHEIGHAVGLKHPFEGLFRLSEHLDSSRNTVMSYTRDNTPTALARLDVEALQTLYGASINTTGWVLNVSSGDMLIRTSVRGDAISGAGGIDNKIYGLAGADSLFGREANDTLVGGDGADVLVGLKGNDLIYGGAGADKVYGTSVAVDKIDDTDEYSDTLSGGAGSDYIVATASIGKLAGGTGNDTLIGSGSHDHQFGNAGNDVLKQKTGLGWLYGGAGNDKLSGSNADYGDLSVEQLQQMDLLRGGNGYDTLYGNGGADRLFADGDGGVLFGGDGNDSLRGGPSGNSRLFGGAGNDQLHAGKGAASLYGGAGDDSLVGANVTASTVEGALMEGGAGHDILRSGSTRDQLFGGAENDVLFGVAGNRLEGGVGQDLLIFEPDMVGQATIAGFEPGVDSIIIQNLSDDPTLFEVELVGQSGGVLARITPFEGAAAVTLVLEGIDLAHVAEDMFIGQTGEWAV